VSQARVLLGVLALVLASGQQADPALALARALADLAGPASAAARRAAARELGDLAWGNERSDERVLALARAAREDLDGDVRRACLRGLGEIGSASAARELEGLVEGTTGADRARAAEHFAELPAARERLIARVVQGALGSGGPWSETTVLATTLSAYGRALAVAPDGGVDPRERGPLVLGALHPALLVRRAARAALEGALDEWVARGELERADGLLSDLAADGLDALECLYRRAYLALAHADRPERALELGRTLEERARAQEPESWASFGCLFQAAGHVARGDFARAEAPLARAEQALVESIARRDDLAARTLVGRVHPLAGAGGAAQAERWLARALVETWRALLDLLRGDEAGRESALVHARSAHALALRAQLAALRTDAAQAPQSLDALLLHDMGPRRLLLASPRRRARDARLGLDLDLALARAFAAVAPREMPGFVPLAQVSGARGDPLADPERRELLEALRAAAYASLQRQEMQALSSTGGRIGPERAQQLLVLRAQRRAMEEALRREGERLSELGPLEALDPARLREVLSDLLDQRHPSLHALTLSHDLRQEGRAEESRELAGALLSAFDQGLAGTNTFVAEIGTANLLMSIASSLMDEERAAEAAQALDEAVRRLEAAENTLAERLAQLAAEAGAKEGGARAELEVARERVRERLANALVTLAVNANVRLRDPVRALGFFERAYALDQRPFMRVLLACYRARSGRAAEARALLVGVEPSPELYYNLACTWALLDERELAFDFLARELAENHPTSGSLARQRAWAETDPDLATLRSDERFRRLVGGEGR
jgi:hypothetical protein